MKPGRVVMSTFFVMLIVQTIGSIDSKQRLPAPRQFVAISVLWGILFLMADTSLNRIAARLSALIVLTGMVLGPFGKVAVSFLNKIAEEFAIPPVPTLPSWAKQSRPTSGDTDDTDATGGPIIA